MTKGLSMHAPNVFVCAAYQTFDDKIQYFKYNDKYYLALNIKAR